MASAFSRVAALAAIFLGLIAFASAASARYRLSPRSCSGRMRYKVTFHMAWTRARFSAKTVPANAMISPLTAATHISRFSPFAEWCTANSQVETVAEGGQNMPLVKYLRSLGGRVGDVQFLTKPGPASGNTAVTVTADAGRRHTQLSAITMLAPTPDWVTFENNIQLCKRGRWVAVARGPLYGYDAGTEKTPGVDQQPQQNIYRLSSPTYPKYDNTAVGYYTVTLLKD